jgi:CheY-like chemotaxis protein
MSRRLLVIDDEEAIQQIIEACLVDLGGWDVLTASSGRDGIALAQAHAQTGQSEGIDGILLDISMPDLNGFETLALLKSDPITEAIPVVLLTARVLTADRQQFESLAIAAVIEKPFDPLGLVDQVTQAFGWAPEALQWQSIG